jgi:hypothetical protein
VLVLSSSIFSKKKKRSATMLDKQHSIRLLKTNKKRIVNKRNNKLKDLKILIIENNAEPSKSVALQEKKKITIVKEISIEGLPVTFLLKLGKEFFSDLEAVKYYYNSKQDEFYKNRSLLEESLQKSINGSPLDVQTKISEFIANK